MRDQCSCNPLQFLWVDQQFHIQYEKNQSHCAAQVTPKRIYLLITTIRFSHARSCSHESRTPPSVARVPNPKKRNQSALRVSDARKFGYKKAFANSKLILPVGVSEHERKFKVKTVPTRTYSEDFDRVDGNPLTARVERRFTTIFVARLLTLQATPLRKKFSKWLSYRRTLSLNENWQFIQDDNLTDQQALRATGNESQTVSLPHTWNAHDAA
jgi:hypothetical protein